MQLRAQPPALVALLATALLAAPAGPARSGSVLELPYPAAFGAYAAAAYGDAGEVVGGGSLTIRELADGRVRLVVFTEIDSGASMEATALLAPIAGKRALRMVEQRSESRDEKGRSLGVLRVDHASGVGSCTQEGQAPERLELPADERIVNVPLNLLFQHMASDPGDEVDFQIFLCRGGPRVVDFLAGSQRDLTDGVMEIRYQPNLGPFVNWAAGSVIPKLSFWIASDGSYVGHRIPLYQSGPEVLMVRDGVAPSVVLTQAAH